MNIRIPRIVLRFWEQFADWGNVTLYERGRLDIRRLDVLLTVLLIGSTAYYYTVYGWYWALINAGMFCFFLMWATILRD